MPTNEDDNVRRALFVYTEEVNRAYGLYSEQLIDITRTYETRKKEVVQSLQRSLDDAQKSLFTNLGARP